jgi:hypothetical protein
MTNDKSLKTKLTCAVLYMSYGNGQTPKYVPPSRTVASIRVDLSLLKKGAVGKRWTQEQKFKLKGRVPHNKGVPMTEDAKKHLSLLNTGKKKGSPTVEQKIQISQSLKGATKGLIPWNNGETTVKSKECPGHGWHQGCLRSTVKGMKWWTNGILDKRSHTSPGDGWQLGRLFKYKKINPSPI